MNRPLLAAIRTFLALTVFAALQAQAAVIGFSVQSLGGSLFRYDYSVTHQAGDAPIALIDIEFDPSLYLESSLNIVSDPSLAADWDQIIIGSQSGLPALFDLFALGAPLDGGASLTGFAIEFEWLGNGLPGVQAFSISDPDTFDVLASGRTRPAVAQPVPEPSTLALLGLAGAIFLRRSRSVPSR